MRDRLIELLKSSPCLDVMYEEYKEWEKAADYLLANGVIVPPCKVGDTVYTDVYYEIKGFVVTSIELAYTPNGIESEFVASNGEYPLLFKFENVSKTVFLTKEEAERALAERSIKWIGLA